MKEIRYTLVCLALISAFAPGSVSALAEDTIHIAAIYALTGIAAEENSFSLDGVRTAVNEINEQGGVLGKKIKLSVFDNESTPIGSHLAAVKAADAGVAAIVGAEWSSHSIAAAKVAQSRRIPMILNISTLPSLTKIGDCIFRVCFTDDFLGNVMAEFAYNILKARTAVVFVDLTSDYSMGLTEVFRKRFEALGGRILLELEYKLKEKKFDGLILKTKKAHADTVFLSGYTESGLIAKMLQDAGVSSVPIGGDGWTSPTFLSKGGNKLKLGYCGSHWSEEVDTDASRLFVEKYKHLGNLTIGTALGYDAVRVLADAIRRAGSADRGGIRDALAKTRDFQGVTGNITFNADREPAKNAVIIEIRDGKPRYFKTFQP